MIKHQSHHNGHIQYLRLLPVNEEDDACIHLIHSNELFDSIENVRERWLVCGTMIQRNPICIDRSHTPLSCLLFSLYFVQCNTSMTARLRLYTLHAAYRHNATHSTPCYRLLHVSTRQLAKADASNDGTSMTVHQ